MANYLLVYRGGGAPQNESDIEAEFAAWEAWSTALGADLVDGGNPTGPSMLLTAGGSATEGAPSGLTGYSILAADNLADATAKAKGCPILASGGDIEIYETFDVNALRAG